MFKAGAEKKMFSVEERELPWLTQEEAETRGFRKDCGVADPSRSCVQKDSENVRSYLSDLWSMTTWSPIPIPDAAFCRSLVFFGPCILVTR